MAFLEIECAARVVQELLPGLGDVLEFDDHVAVRE
jgi:hypothetical protein